MRGASVVSHGWSPSLFNSLSERGDCIAGLPKEETKDLQASSLSATQRAPRNSQPRGSQHSLDTFGATPKPGTVSQSSPAKALGALRVKTKKKSPGSWTPLDNYFFLREV